MDVVVDEKYGKERRNNCILGRLSSRVSKNKNRCAIFPFPREQSSFMFQKLERREIAFSCERGLLLAQVVFDWASLKGPWTDFIHRQCVATIHYQQEFVKNNTSSVNLAQDCALQLTSYAKLTLVSYTVQSQKWDSKGFQIKTL